MRIATCAALFLSASLITVRAQQAGMQNVWDIHNTLSAIALHADRLAPFVDQIHPENWTGAPEGYVAQAKTCRNEVRAVAAAARKLSQNPEKLTDALETLFQIRTEETMLASLGEGLRKYSNPPMADLLNAAVAENAANRDRLQQYILELAAAREQEFRVADEEAQRCRQSLSRQSPQPQPARPKQEKN
jgi:hypothetical protein